MSDPIHILIAEDSPDDAALIERELKRAGLDFRMHRVDTSEGLDEALAARDWDLVLSDYMMPGFSGIDALRQVRDRDPDVPFIIVSGTIDQRLAVAAMRNGAQDYVMKDDVGRLAPAVERELKEADVRRRQREAEQALLAHEELLSAIIQTSPNCVFVRDRDERFILVNKATADLFGLTPEEMIGKREEDMDPERQPTPEEISAYHADDDAVRRTGDIVVNERDRLTMPDGSVRWFFTTKAPLSTPRYRDCVLGIALDVTDRMRADEALAESERRYRLLAENVRDVIWTMDVDLNIAYVSPSIEALCGYTPEEMIERGIRQAVSPESMERALKLVADERQAIQDGHEGPLADRSFEVEFLCRNGSTVWTETRAGRLKDAEGRAVGYVGVTRDITDRKRVEAQLVQAQKMEAIGQLAGGVAHDFRNQLTVIRGYSEMLLRQDLVQDQGAEFVQDIIEAAERSAVLTEQLLAFSRKQVLHPEVCDLNAVLSRMTATLGRLIGETVELVMEPQEDLDSVRIDPTQFQQSIFNLVVNARDAMPDGGRIVIETRDVVLDADFVKRHADATPGPHVGVTVRDTGIGMPEDVLDRIFEPFFTTKEVGKGTGLGLPMVYGFVRQSGGCIAVDSTPGAGTAFTIYLPRAATAAGKRPAAREADDALSPGGAEILVVEDEPAIRQVVRQTLNQYGYRVEEAADAAQAINRLRARNRPPDLLITDVIMPGMDGVQLAERVRQLFPDVEVLYISGYAARALQRHGIDEGEVNLLAKPFSPRDLARQVEQLLGNRRRDADSA